MKNLITLLITICIVTVGFAQQGINYKAIIKDNTGNVIANDLVIVQFSILQGVSETNVYTETHTPTTDANGLVILNIGEGTQASGDYATIDWGVDTHALNVQINNGGGLVDMGTTNFQMVPYSKHALTAAYAEISGDNKWDEGTTVNDITNNNTGKVEIAGELQIQTTASIDEFSIDGTLIDNSDSAVPTEQAVKTYVDTNLATGLEALDEGNGIGWRLKGSNPNAYGSIGQYAIDLSLQSSLDNMGGATLESSFASGLNTSASGFIATAMGQNTEASGLVSTAIGFQSIASGTYSTAIGNASEATGNSTISAGLDAEAIADFSVAIGKSARSEGENSIALGLSAYTSGDASMSLGNAAALGGFSVAIGSVTTAEGARSVAIGYGLEAFSFGEVVLGSWNSSYFPMSTFDNDPEDRLFVIGNGTQFSKRNALTMFKSGKTGLGIEDPEARLHLKSDNNETGLAIKSFANVNNPQIEIIEGGVNSGSRINFTNSVETTNRWTLFTRTDNTDIDSQFNFFYSGQPQNIMSLRGDGNVFVNGALVHSSDRRLKKDIQKLSYGLKEVLQLEPKEYFWKSKPNQEQASLGLIAQEVQEIIANVVLEGTDDDKTLSVSYTELIPVLINAIKEQQVIIENQNTINTMQASQLEALLNRMVALETKSSN